MALYTANAWYSQTGLYLNFGLGLNTASINVFKISGWFGIPKSQVLMHSKRVIGMILTQFKMTYFDLFSEIEMFGIRKWLKADYSYQTIFQLIWNFF